MSADDAPEEKVPEGMTSTAAGVDTNQVVAPEREEIGGQTPDQFYGGEGFERPDQAEAPRNHATKGMTILGHTEASRIEDTAEAQDRDRAAAEKAAAKAAKE